MISISVQRDTAVGVIAAMAALSFLVSLIGVGANIEGLAASGALAFVGATVGTVWAAKQA